MTPKLFKVKWSRLRNYLTGFIMDVLPERIYRKPIKADLLKKMVFIGGPRQIGKTTLAQTFIKKFFDTILHT